MKSILLALIITLSSNLLCQVDIGITNSYPKKGVGSILSFKISDNVSVIGSFDFGKYSNINVTKLGIGIRYKNILLIPNINKSTAYINKYSIEIGIIDEFIKGINFIMLYDIINLEPRIGLSFVIFR